MKSFQLLFSLLGALATVTGLQGGNCVSRCPQVKCLVTDEIAVCRCINNRERRCYRICPDYTPTFTLCPAKPISTPISAPSLDSTASCVCDDVFCIQMWPDSCHCANDAAQKCYEKCGVVPALQSCGDGVPPLSISTLTTSTKTKTPSATSTYASPTPIHQICGGGRANSLSCGDGYTCIADPYTPNSCGPACDQWGICVKDEMCGGFAGKDCEGKGQVCHDDPRDDCDPHQGGADCAGLCVWSHGSVDDRVT
ncbi:hypothetical protein EJ02DRAFT_480047 [Clathrospora elynae]|uniref:Uncharacterized protein n=1 Tax=Clathrospora elynae TaxID=706981 RepID=A0A6A5S7F6_9PLEO|nr:hypothetical protein EJ02DRAFT_480047 [Clathrospora elynae]